MLTIYKYQIKLEPRTNIQMPRGAKILSFQMQNGRAYIWSLVDLEQELTEEVFILLGTGHGTLTPDTTDYIGTVQNGSFVWHLFHLKKETG